MSKPAIQMKATAHPIRAARCRRGLSQDALAIKVGALAPAISKWEQGQAYPRPATAFRLSKVLRIPLEDVYASARAA